MPLESLNALLCPLCYQPLTQTSRQWQCPSQHSFDIARQGYVNLLPVQNKRSKDPGDSREMIDARRRFLDSSSYQPVAEALLAECRKLLPSGGAISVLDAGSGDGYYLDYLCRHLQAGFPSVTATALDISKWAVRACRSRNPGLNALVASNRKIPLPSKSQDLLLCNFGFPVFDEFKRVLKAGGSIVLLDAGPEHLIELRELLYPTVRRSPPPTLNSAMDTHWQLHSDTTIRYRTPLLQRELLNDLLLMTPHFHRCSAEGRKRVEQIPKLAVKIEVHLRVIQHRP